MPARYFGRDSFEMGFSERKEMRINLLLEMGYTDFHCPAAECLRGNSAPLAMMQEVIAQGHGIVVRLVARAIHQRDAAACEIGA